MQHPLYFLDFETIATAIHLFEGTRPFEQVPFTFSLHIVRRPGEPPGHHSFLAEGRHDPRQELPDRLRGLLGAERCIVAYNATFEIGVLERLCEASGGLDTWLFKHVGIPLTCVGERQLHSVAFHSNHPLHLPGWITGGEVIT